MRSIRNGSPYPKICDVCAVPDPRTKRHAAPEMGSDRRELGQAGPSDFYFRFSRAKDVAYRNFEGWRR
jgi:hypothetical protein